MIVINGNKYAETENEFIDSLFSSGGTCSGYAKRRKRDVLFMDHQHIPFGVVNAHGVVGSARELDNGRVWYSYGTPSQFGTMPYSYECSIADSLAVGRDQIGLLFK